jgi:predicted HTH transcriptional regulator
MNSDILIKEIYDIVDYLKQNTINSAYNSNFILSDSFFNADNSVDLNKGQAQKHDSSKTNKNKLLIVKDKKDTRQNSIINLLKKSSNLTIKDFVKVITDCSEKTIQRELIQLVEKGIVKREGERRWSTYSLL